MSAAKQKGTAWESKIVDYLRVNGAPHAERRAQTGVNDQGDISGIPGVVTEAKNAQRTELPAWVDEAEREAANVGPGTLAVVWHHRRGKASPADGLVTMTGRQWVHILALMGYITAKETE